MLAGVFVSGCVVRPSIMEEGHGGALMAARKQRQEGAGDKTSPSKGTPTRPHLPYFSHLPIVHSNFESISG
jgi:hypothetical protein